MENLQAAEAARVWRWHIHARHGGVRRIGRLLRGRLDRLPGLLHLGESRARGGEITAPDRAERVGELVAEDESGLRRRGRERGNLARPLLGVEQITGAHADHRTPERALRRANRLMALLHHCPGRLGASLLQVAVGQPERIVSARAGGGCGRDSPRDLDRRLVGLDHVVPHAHRDEDVRAHVLRVRRGWRDLRVLARGAQT